MKKPFGKKKWKNNIPACVLRTTDFVYVIFK